MSQPFTLKDSAATGLTDQTDYARWFTTLAKCGDSPTHFLFTGTDVQSPVTHYVVVVEVIDEATLNVGALTSIAGTIGDPSGWYIERAVPIPGTDKFIAWGQDYAASTQRYRIATRSGMSASYGSLDAVSFTNSPRWILGVALSSTLFVAFDTNQPRWFTYSISGSTLTAIANGVLPNTPADYVNGGVIQNNIFVIDSTHILLLSGGGSFPDTEGHAQIFEVTGGGTGLTAGTVVDTYQTPQGDGQMTVFAEDVSHGKVWIRNPSNTSPLDIVPYTFSGNTLVPGAATVTTQDIGSHMNNTFVSGDGTKIMAIVGTTDGDPDTVGPVAANLVSGELFALGSTDRVSGGLESLGERFSQPVLNDCLIDVDFTLQTFRLWQVPDIAIPPPLAPSIRLVWDESTNRNYEYGVDRGVLYPADGPAVVWNGLTSVSEIVDNEISPGYYDGKKVSDIVTVGSFSATVKAITYPKELLDLEGISSLRLGIYVTEQDLKPFGLTYRTRIGSALDQEAGYKLHIVYNAIAISNEIIYETLTDAINPIEFEWTIDAVPEEVSGFYPTAHIVINSLTASPLVLSTLEDILYGTSVTEPHLPLMSELLGIILHTHLISVSLVGGGRYRASTSTEGIIETLMDETFTITGISGEYLDADTYVIRDTD